MCLFGANLCPLEYLESLELIRAFWNHEHDLIALQMAGDAEPVYGAS